MKYLSIILLFSCLSCSTWNTATITTGYGQPTAIHSISHTKSGDDYTTLTVAQQSDNWEINISRYKYKINDEIFETSSIGTKYHLIKEFGWFIIDGGLGLRLTSKNTRNKWLAYSNLLGDISLGFGIKKEFEDFNVKLFYILQHLSVPFRHDKGLNYDMIQFGISVPF